MATAPSSAAMSRVRSPSSLASSFNFIASPNAMHANDLALSSDDSFESLSEDSSSDDEIVWSVSDLSASFISSQRDPRSPSIFSEDDFIVLGQPSRADAPTSPRSSDAPSVSADGLSDVFNDLTIEDSLDASSNFSSSRPASQAATPSKRSRRPKARAAATVSAAPSPAQMPTAPVTPKRKRKVKAAPAPAAKEVVPKKSRKKAKAKKVQPATEAGLGARPIVDDVSEAGDVKTVSLYDDAVQYISS
ncbi:uncharacterized protein PHACADRAFT_256432 [Phanerochaete carnosa HHB-10118-sp]|uniref:Uncharacterized protein n=1 Tax=Phanerochaete carnosa (strain HHB-10118-sp) TaxID=650164 RepID=K5VVS5_PHACS|nr:uncharacterized protein PHACADRAFT_256432 [Phanerochaete carnosa HHB-10118-sp]EKM55653.1 hypothetical protein PHACADRAFT_256432 [Phanerochaete carnosa HHB-10118-sp]